MTQGAARPEKTTPGARWVRNTLQGFLLVAHTMLVCLYVLKHVMSSSKVQFFNEWGFFMTSPLSFILDK